MIAATVTLTATDTGVSLLTLLQALTGVDKVDIPVAYRVACLKIGYIGSSEVYLVPRTGAYITTVGNTPDQYGWNFAEQGTWFEMAYPQNSISLDEIIVGGISGESLHVFAFAI